MINPTHYDFWNAIGMGQAVKILHIALIHPETPTKAVFSPRILKNKLLPAIKLFFEIGKSLEYLQRVPANGTFNFTFEFSSAVTGYINEPFTKVCQKYSTLISYPDCYSLQYQELLATENLAVEENWESLMLTETGKDRKKKVNVYTIELREEIK